MSRRTGALPPGYERVRFDGVELVSLAGATGAMREALAAGTLYDYASRHPMARPLAGRGIAYAVPLPDGGPRVVVRRSRHGGLLAPLTGDRFLSPTRAPRELAIALRLAETPVPTPQLVGYATYPAGPARLAIVRRADVVTREIPRARDLAEALLASSLATRGPLWLATARLVASLTRAGARHPDLNLKNVLIAHSADENVLPGDEPKAGPRSPLALVLDVDRIEFGRPGDPRITAANLARLVRSARKWRDFHGATVEESELSSLRAAAQDPAG